jgi:hypothetical protein
MDAGQTLAFLALGGFLGLVGQFVRAIVGVKKDQRAAAAANPPQTQWFDAKELVIGLIVGTAAGVIAAITQLGPAVTISNSLAFGFVAAGYSGADFINGVMKGWLPANQ